MKLKKDGTGIKRSGGNRKGAGNVSKPPEERRTKAILIKIFPSIDPVKLRIYNYRAIYCKDVAYILLSERPDYTVDEVAALTARRVQTIENFCKKLGIVIKEDRTTEIPPINPKDIFIEEEW